MEEWGFSDSFIFRTVGTVASISTGIPIGGSDVNNNVKGTYTQLVASTPIDSDFSLLTLYSDDNARRTLFDLAIGPAGSEIVIFSNFSYNNSSRDPTAIPFFLPISIPINQRIAIRHQNAIATSAINHYATLHLFRHGLNIPMEVGSYVQSIGVNTSTSSATTLPNGGTNIKGAWTQLIAQTTISIKLLFIMLGYPFDSNAGAFGLIDLGIGPSGQETIIFPNIPLIYSNARSVVPFIIGPLPMNIPQGVRIAARIQAENSSLDNGVYISLLGVG